MVTNGHSTITVVEWWLVIQSNDTTILLLRWWMVVDVDVIVNSSPEHEGRHRGRCVPITVGDNGEPPVKRESLGVGDQLHIGIPRWITKDWLG